MLRSLLRGLFWAAALSNACLWFGLWMTLQRHPAPDGFSLPFHPLFVLACLLASTLWAAFADTGRRDEE